MARENKRRHLDAAPSAAQSSPLRDVQEVDQARQIMCIDCCLQVFVSHEKWSPPSRRVARARALHSPCHSIRRPQRVSLYFETARGARMYSAPRSPWHVETHETRGWDRRRGVRGTVRPCGTRGCARRREFRGTLKPLRDARMCSASGVSWPFETR